MPEVYIYMWDRYMLSDSYVGANCGICMLFCDAESSIPAYFDIRGRIKMTSLGDG